MTDRVLHFTLGPVQSFVAQARRTRDLWAGSYLLSWLAGQGMLAIVKGGYGRIVVPSITKDQLFLALQDPNAVSLWPRIGSLPNRFSAVITDPQFDPAATSKTQIQSKWEELADLVWNVFIADVADKGFETKKIWDRQIETFWDMSWVVGANSVTEDGKPESDKWLDYRKNWRTHWPPEEPGDHCMLMGDWQEISGFVRACEHKKQEEFWIALRNHVSENLYRSAPDKKVLELGKGERLCAIALVKRLFPVLFSRHMSKDVFDKAAKILGFVPSGLPASEARDTHGEAVRAWRSTAHIAATPWLRRIERDHAGKCDEYVDAIRNLAKDKSAKGVIFAERAGAIPSLSDRPIAKIDGALFYHDSLLRKADHAWGPPLGSEDGERTKVEEGLKIRKKLSVHLSALQEATKPIGSARGAKGREASPFYAVLLMDGDSMGKLIGELGGENVSLALAKFTEEAAKSPGDHVTIYAGGDDYLGLFPLSDVIDGAIWLRKAYVDAFNAQAKTNGKGSISAAVVFAPHDMPLTQVIREAHTLLDDIAKDKNGRDSIALRVHKSSGPMATWVSKWGDGEKMPSALLKLANDMAKEDEHSSGYLYKLREVYEEYYQDHPIDEKEEERLYKILLAERLVGRDANDKKVRDQAETHVQSIVKACLTYSEKSKIFSLNGALIARFIADNGCNINGGAS